LIESTRADLLPPGAAVRDHAPVRLLAVRVLAVLCALTWLVLPGFGLIDLSVSWDADWPVVLEASWGGFMTVLVGGSFLAVAVRPRRSAPAAVVLVVALGALLVSAAAGLEWQLLGYAALLAVELPVLLLVPDRERVRPAAVSPWLPLLLVAVAGAAPWLVHAARVYRMNRGDAGEAIGELTMGVDHHAVQGALAVALVALSVAAAVWPRGRRHLGLVTGACAGYFGLVSFAFPGSWAGLSPTWSVLCMAWGAAVAVLALAAPRVLEPREFGGEVVEAQRAL
jgi:hypothetical protein